MEYSELEASERKILGKKVRQLRRRGFIPANVYGRNIPSTALQVDARALADIIRRVGTRRIINLKIAGAVSPRPVLIRSIQRKPMTGEILHVDLYEVSMREKLRLHLPVVLKGEAPALKNTDGILVRNLDTIEVEALPGDLPPTIEVDVSQLEQIGDSVLVQDLAPPKGVTILANPEDPVVTIAPPMAEEVPAEEAEEAAEAGEEEAGEGEERS